MDFFSTDSLIDLDFEQDFEIKNLLQNSDQYLLDAKVSKQVEGGGLVFGGETFEVLNDVESLKISESNGKNRRGKLRFIRNATTLDLTLSSVSDGKYSIGDDGLFNFKVGDKLLVNIGSRLRGRMVYYKHYLFSIDQAEISEVTLKKSARINLKARDIFGRLADNELPFIFDNGWSFTRGVESILESAGLSHLTGFLFDTSVGADLAILSKEKVDERVKQLNSRGRGEWPWEVDLEDIERMSCLEALNKCFEYAKSVIDLELISVVKKEIGEVLVVRNPNENLEVLNLDEGEIESLSQFQQNDERGFKIVNVSKRGSDFGPEKTLKNIRFASRAGEKNDYFELDLGSGEFFPTISRGSFKVNFPLTALNEAGNKVRYFFFERLKPGVISRIRGRDLMRAQGDKADKTISASVFNMSQFFEEGYSKSLDVKNILFQNQVACFFLAKKLLVNESKTLSQIKKLVLWNGYPFFSLGSKVFIFVKTIDLFYIFEVNEVSHRFASGALNKTILGLNTFKAFTASRYDEAREYDIGFAYDFYTDEKGDIGVLTKDNFELPSLLALQATKAIVGKPPAFPPYL